MFVYSQTSEPLVCRAKHGIALFPVKLDHPDGGKIRYSYMVCLLSMALQLSDICWKFLTSETCHAQWEWLHRHIAGSVVPVYVLEETLFTPAVQQLRHHKLKESRTCCRLYGTRTAMSFTLKWLYTSRFIFLYYINTVHVEHSILPCYITVLRFLFWASNLWVIAAILVQIRGKGSRVASESKDSSRS